MRLLAVRRADPRLPGFEARLEGTVRYDDGESEVIWVEFAGDPVPDPTDEADPWIVMLLPGAVATGEGIETDLPVDRTLLFNLGSLQRVWSAWYPELSPVPVRAPVVNRFPSSRDHPRSSASLFSGGVDSFHILARSTGPDRVLELGGLITVWGFDIPLTKPGEFEVVRRSAEDVASSLGLETNLVATNMRQSRFDRAWWGGMSHGCALSAVGLLFTRTYDRILIGSSHSLPEYRPWGSHVLTDPLCSTSACTIVHYGASETRVEKTRSLVSLEAAQKHLRVCWQEQAAGNCGRCSKCVRTMATLKVLGHLDRFETFRGQEFSPTRLETIQITRPTQVDFLLEIAEEAAARGDEETARAATAAVRRYRRDERIGRLARPVVRRLGPAGKHLPYFWRFSRRRGR